MPNTTIPTHLPSAPASVQGARTIFINCGDGRSAPDQHVRPPHHDCTLQAPAEYKRTPPSQQNHRPSSTQATTPRDKPARTTRALQPGRKALPLSPRSQRGMDAQQVRDAVTRQCSPLKSFPVAQPPEQRPHARAVVLSLPATRPRPRSANLPPLTPEKTRRTNIAPGGSTTATGAHRRERCIAPTAIPRHSSCTPPPANTRSSSHALTFIPSSPVRTLAIGRRSSIPYSPSSIPRASSSARRCFSSPSLPRPEFDAVATHGERTHAAHDYRQQHRTQRRA